MITFVVGGWGEEGTLISYLEKRRGEVTLPFRIEFHCGLLRKSVAQAYPEEPALVAVSDPKLPRYQAAEAAGELSCGEVQTQRAEPTSDVMDPTNFRGLVLGCIEAKFCK